MLSQLGNRWPETDNYLERIGQINNDLQVLREMQAAQNHVPDFLEQLAIDTTDILALPEAMSMLRLLHEYEVTVESLETVQGYREARDEFLNQERALYQDQTHWVDVLGDSVELPLTSETEQQIQSLPELHTKVRVWAAARLAEAGLELQPVSLTQALMIVNLMLYLEQEEAGSEWQADCLQSLRSTSFYSQAASQAS